MKNYYCFGNRFEHPTIGKTAFLQLICIQNPLCFCKELMQWRGSRAFVSLVSLSNASERLLGVAMVIL